MGVVQKPIYKLFLAVLFLLPFTFMNAQLDLPRPSPKAEVSSKAGNADVTITYCRPGVKERTIWGGLVPYNEVWRTGANERTKIEFSEDVKVNGNPVTAGTYSLFTIPGETEWTVILNKNYEDGVNLYDEKEDALRFTVKPMKSQLFHERMTFVIFANSQKDSDVGLAWENLMLKFNVATESTHDKVSPAASVYQRIGVTDVKVTYASPAVKGREIFGGLVPYEKIWRSGANEATTVEFSTDVTIEGNNVPAGKYALFTIPGENEWTIILNKTHKQWGAYKYDQSQDQLRFKVKAESNPARERLFFVFYDLDNGSSKLNLKWADKKVAFKIETDVLKFAYDEIQRTVKETEGKDWSVFSSAANFAVDYDSYLDEAKAWAKKGASMEAHWWANYVAAKTHHKLGDNATAKTYLDKSYEIGKQQDNYDAFKGLLDTLNEKL